MTGFKLALAALDAKQVAALEKVLGLVHERERLSGLRMLAFNAGRAWVRKHGKGADKAQALAVAQLQVAIAHVDDDLLAANERLIAIRTETRALNATPEGVEYWDAKHEAWDLAEAEAAADARERRADVEHPAGWFEPVDD